MSVSDETMAAWVKEQNRGAPAWADLDASARAWWRDRYTIRHAGIKQDQPNIVKQVVNAWDCCGTCAGGVMAQHTRERIDAALEDAAQAIEAKYLGADFGRQYDGRESPDAALHNAYNEGLQTAVEAVRAQKRGAQ